MFKHIFISPHIDDAFFSCGGLILKLCKKEKILIVNLFSGSDKNQEKEYARKYLDFCGFKTSKEYFEIRKKEEKKLTLKYGFESIFLEFPEAIFRHKENFFRRNYFYNSKKKLFGRIDPAENNLCLEVEEAVSRIIVKKAFGNPFLYFPLGEGNHIDHQMVSRIGIKIGERIKTNQTKIFFYQDFPYCFWKGKQKTKLNCFERKIELKKRIYLNQKILEEKKTAVNAYRSQIIALFGSKENFERSFDLYYKNPYENYWTIKKN